MGMEKEIDGLLNIRKQEQMIPNRMLKFLKLLVMDDGDAQFEQAIIFVDRPRLQCDGFGWAPESFLGYPTLFDKLLGGGYGRWHKEGGLIVYYPGIEFDSSRPLKEIIESMERGQPGQHKHEGVSGRLWIDTKDYESSKVNSWLVMLKDYDGSEWVLGTKYAVIVNRNENALDLKSLGIERAKTLPFMEVARTTGLKAMLGMVGREVNQDIQSVRFLCTATVKCVENSDWIKGDICGRWRDTGAWCVG